MALTRADAPAVAAAVAAEHAGREPHAAREPEQAEQPPVVACAHCRFYAVDRMNLANAVRLGLGGSDGDCHFEPVTVKKRPNGWCSHFSAELPA